MIVKDYKPIGHIDFIDGTRVPVVKETEVRCDVFKQVINFIAVDGEIYQYQKNAEKYSTTYNCKFYKFDHKNCWFEPAKDVKIVEIYCKYGAFCYTPTIENPKAEWVRTSPKPALIWPGDHSTMWVPNIKYENLKKDYTILANALKKLNKYSTFVTYTRWDELPDGSRIPERRTNYVTRGRGIEDQDTVALLKEAFDIAEKEDTPDNTLRKLYYNIHNYHVLQKKYEQLNNDYSELKKGFDLLEKSSDESNDIMHKACDDYRDKIYYLEEDNKELKKRNDILEDENNSLLEDVKELDGRYKALREKHDVVRKERYELSKEYEELLKEYENITKFTVLPRIAMSSEECTELRKKNKDLENHLAAVNADNEKHISTIAGLNDEIRELKKEVSSLQQENSALVVSRNLYKSSKGTLEFSLRGQIAGLSLANGRLEAELAIARDANNTIKEKYIELEKENKELRGQVTEYNNRYIKAKNRLYNEKDNLISKLSIEKGKVDVLLQERQRYIEKSKRYAEALNIIDSNLGWSPRRDKEGAPYYYASSLILEKDIHKIKQTLQEARHENN